VELSERAIEPADPELSNFRGILTELNGAGVRYVLVGGIALIRHGVVRATRDHTPTMTIKAKYTKN
jgi:hypothetical protein